MLWVRMPLLTGANLSEIGILTHADSLLWVRMPILTGANLSGSAS